MTSEDSVHPLRLTKSNTMPMPPQPGSAVSRPLSEISPMEKRRNSPSWNQTTKQPQKMPLNTDSSPFQSSPLSGASPLDGTTSPRLFWQNRSVGSENQSYFRSGSPSPTRRSSIERLQRASRVKNSNILALEHKNEYDPTKIPQIERPLREGRPFGHQRSESKTSIPIFSPSKSNLPAPPAPFAEAAVRPPTPSKDQTSPIKSSMSTSRFKSSFDHEMGTWSAESSTNERELPNGKYLHRHAKSVTFDAAPPQVNEYELATPDISTIGSDSREGSYDSLDDDEDVEHYMIHEGDSQDDSFDASLEDTDKTPVVGPEDWRQDGQDGHDDVFERSPMPDDLPVLPRPQHGRSDSTTSNGDHRPLPPLPGGQRSLPSLPHASAETHNIGNGRMPLEERLKLMMLSDDGKNAAEQQRERRLRRAGTRDRADSHTPEREARSPSVATDGEEGDTIGDLEEYQLPPRISRESILRRVNGNRLFERESDYNFSTPPPGSSPARDRHIPLDPDVPIPSTEQDDSLMEDTDEEGSVIITRDSHGKDSDAYSVSDMSEDDDHFEREEREETVDSQFSDVSPHAAAEPEAEDDRSSTPRANTPLPQQQAVAAEAQPLAAPSSSDETHDNDFTKGLESYMLAKPEEPIMAAEPEKQVVEPQVQRPVTPEQKLTRSLTKPEYDGSGWGEPEDEYDEPGTPESVIHHPVSDDSEQEEDDPVESPFVPEQVATIKSAAGSKLKTRPSATPSDIMAMREARRQVSREVPIPPIPDRHRNRLSRDMGAEVEQLNGGGFLDRHPSFKKRSLTLDLDLGLSLDKDFERVIEAQKRGYLMRQNTKLVAASDKDTEDLRGHRSAGNSPVKASRPQSWVVEPWNPQVRKRSSVRKRVAPSGPVPPLPGQESNATAMNTLNEEDMSSELATEETGERGRLFVKVMGVKDLDLPIPKNERTWFSLTLDNGVHCVTTAWLELARNAPIGQEFELVVPNDLEFQLTLNVKLEKPAPRKVIPSPTKVSKPKTSTFSRVFASPKKRKEMEQRHREEEERLAQQQREAQARQMAAHPTAWDLLSPLAAEDGSFARSYVCLKEHEPRCFGRPYLVEVAAFNEWATEEAGFASSVKSKRGNTAVVRKAPYKIGKLELQLLFVPRPKGATDDDMPKSMNSCIREMKAAEERLSQQWEGHLSQQGGDCPYWRRRYFKLVGTKLTAYHEATRQPRATINLANAKRLIDDRRALMEKEVTAKGGKRRRSAFAEDEEGYMFVEEGFRIRFNNGELIDFYADSTQDKEGWMKVLSEVINKDSSTGGADDDWQGSRAKGKWCELVLKREEALKRRVEGRRVHSRTKSMYV